MIANVRVTQLAAGDVITLDGDATTVVSIRRVRGSMREIEYRTAHSAGTLYLDGREYVERVSA